jgi:hypothetical protein
MGKHTLHCPSRSCERIVFSVWMAALTPNSRACSYCLTASIPSQDQCELMRLELKRFGLMRSQFDEALES